MANENMNITDEAVKTAPEAETEPKAEQTEAAENEYLIKFSKPYTWEGKEYTELDLSGLKKLTVKDAVSIQKKLFNDGEAATAMICETTTAFAREIACQATGIPIEFFKLMPMKYAKTVKAAVQAFLSSNNDNESVLVLSEPYTYEGKSYKEIAVDGLAELNSLNMSHAENEMTKEGFLITMTQFNYLYACVILSMATNLPTEFYTGLPLKELLNIKNIANNSDFFE